MGELKTVPVAKPGNADPVRMIDGSKDTISKNKALVATTSTALTTILGVAVPNNVVGVTIISDGTVQYNPAGAAAATSGFLPSVYSIHGGKAFLDTVRLYAAGTPVVSVIVFESYSA